MNFFASLELPGRVACRLVLVACLVSGGHGGSLLAQEDSAATEETLLDEFAAPEEKSAEKSEEKSADDSNPAQEVEAEKPPLEIGPYMPALGQDVNADLFEGPVFVAKPGHWSLSVQSMKANYEDFVGEVNAEVVDKHDQPVPLPNVRYGLQLSRPVALAKGKAKQVEANVFAPPNAKGNFLRNVLVNHDTGALIRETRPQIVLAPSYQYVLLVLAKESDQYSFLKATDSVRAAYEEEIEEGSTPHYRVALLSAERNLPLPTNPLQWTEIAYVFWDEFDPELLSGEQQQALIEWLHWGGRMIINGPDSLAVLRESFLDPFLPAEDAGTRTVTNAELKQWSSFWGKREQGDDVVPLQTNRAVSAIKLQLRDGARELPGGQNLFVETVVGRGSIVVSALQLTNRALINWPGYDCFLNGGLLRRPRRVFSEGPYGGLRTEWADFGSQRLDAHLTTPLRWFSRDSHAAANSNRMQPPTQAPPGIQLGIQNEDFAIRVDRPGGIGSWDDHSPVANAARELLLLAAGVRVPGSGFVLGCLLFYLLVLVPVNWLIFRAADRIEWAWFAVPVIALMGTWVVVKQAQLDIGFVRAETEIGLLELQSDHPRGHLTRYSALYSSLSTTYDFDFEDSPTALALPFPANEDSPPWENNVVFEVKSNPTLHGLTVSSAAARLMHIEQMFPLDGPISFGTSSRDQRQIVNHSQLFLEDAFLLHRSSTREGTVRYEGSWLGDLRPQSSALVLMLPVILSAEVLPFETDRKLAHSARQTESTEIDALLKLACQFEDKFDPLQSDREEYRLVAVVRELLPGMQVDPAASQHVSATVVLAHLNYGFPRQPYPVDMNNAKDVVTNTKNPLGFE